MVKQLFDTGEPRGFPTGNVFQTRGIPEVSNSARVIVFVLLLSKKPRDGI